MKTEVSLLQTDKFNGVTIITMQITASTFKPRIDSHHGGMWEALWESLVRKPPGKDTREIHISLDACEGKRDTATTARRKG